MKVIEPRYKSERVTLYCGDCLAVLRQMPEGSVHCVVTSPPYWGLRCYGVDGQLGLEATPDEFIAKMVEVFAEVRRVLRSDGVCWVNLGDSYNGIGGPGKQNGGPIGPTAATAIEGTQGRRVSGLKPKDLCGIPWRVALALQADGWWLRSDIIWAKPNPMPESCTDRPTKSHEYVFLLTKNSRYYYDAEAIRDESIHAGKQIAMGPKSLSRGQQTAAGFDGHWGNATRESVTVTAGRNKRTVWHIATESFPGAHFATFPRKLVQPCIAAGTSDKGCCPECGVPWRRVVEKRDTGQVQKMADGWDTGEGEHGTIHRNGRQQGESGKSVTVSHTVGWEPGCNHGFEPVPCTVLDPFCGSGTSMLVARQMGRQSIGIDLNPDYLDMAWKRIHNPEPDPQVVDVPGQLEMFQ